MQYDQVGNRTRLTQQVEGTTTRVTNYEFDSRSRRTKEFAPLSRTTQWEHDPAGNVLKVTYPDGTFTSTTYHSMDRVLTQTDERGYLTRYTYHASGMVNSIIDPRLNAHTHTYDSAHRLLSRTYPGGSVESWTYDKAGNVATYTNRSGHVQNFTYNTRNRETRKWWNGVVAPEVNTTYDAVGRVLTKINTHSALSYTYDVAGQLLTEAQSVTGRPAVTLTYGYDGDGLRNSFSTTAGQALTYGYTGRSLLKEVKRGTVTVASYTYNLADQRRIRTYANGTASDYNYDAAGRMNYLHTYRPADGSWVVMHRYGHDLRDRRTWSLRSEGFGDTYEYFPDGQLQRYRHMVNRPDQNFNNPAAWTDTFAYDENGNRTSLNENGTVRTFQANTLNQYTSVSGNTLSYTDGRGNQTGWNGWTYTYDAENRLTGAQMSGTSLAFAYDPTGRLVKVTKNGTAEYRYYDGSQCFLRTNGSGTQIDWTIWGSTPDEVLAREDSANGGWQYYHQDMINSVFAVTNTAAGVIERYLYDPFGEPDIRDGSWNPRAAIAIGNPWLFTGQEWRSDLNLSNYKGRWYHPALGRFLQNDPIRFDGGDLNLYRYVDNNPINAVDPDGQFAFLIGAAIGALADTAVQLVNNGGDVKKLNVGSIAASAALGATGVGLGKVAAKVTAQLAISQGAKLAARAAINGAGGAALGAGDASIRNAVSGTNNDVGLAALVGGAGGAVGSALGDVVEAGVNKALTGAAPGKLTQELIDNGQLSGPFTKPISDAPGDLANVATSAGISSATKGVDIDPDKK